MERVIITTRYTIQTVTKKNVECTSRRATLGRRWLESKGKVRRKIRRMVDLVKEKQKKGYKGADDIW
jgi:hypothetical protein